MKINIEKDVTNNTKKSHEYSISSIVVGHMHCLIIIYTTTRIM